MLRNPGRIALLFLGLIVFSYFAFDIVSADLKNSGDKGDDKMSVTFQIKKLADEAGKELNPEQKAEWEELMKSLNSKGEANDELASLKAISGFWYRQQRMDLAGGYAAEVAEIEKTAEAWGIAGTTYMAGLDQMKVEKDRLYCRENSEKAFDRAIALAPEEPQHQMNKALCIVKMPGEEPMKGIMALLGLEKKFPDYLPLQITLSQLAVQTGQWEKAKKRLGAILEKDPGQREANCLMVEVIAGGQLSEDAGPFRKICEAK
ncbi:MAG: hypothetical protein IPG21_19345 [Saprospiraceae bacterium]|nr:hypothetical protein [Candidatus Vicinibacter affinis]